MIFTPCDNHLFSGKWVADDATFSTGSVHARRRNIVLEFFVVAVGYSILL